MCLCVQLQDSHEKPSKDDPKYTDQARNALLAKIMSGQEITMDMLRKEKQKCWRKDYNRWNKRHNRAKARRAPSDPPALRSNYAFFGAENVSSLYDKFAKNVCSSARPRQRACRPHDRGRIPSHLLCGA